MDLLRVAKFFLPPCEMSFLIAPGNKRPCHAGTLARRDKAWQVHGCRVREGVKRREPEMEKKRDERRDKA